MAIKSNHSLTLALDADTENLSPFVSGDNAAHAYLLSLRSSLSRSTMRSFLSRISRMAGFTGTDTMRWDLLRYSHVQAIIDTLLKEDLAPSTINSYLAALKGVARQAWLLKQIDSDAYFHIRDIKSVSGSRLISGRALGRPEIRTLLRSMDSEMTLANLRDAALICTLVGCGLRRSEIVALDLEDLSWNQDAIIVRGKGNKERLAHMPEQLIPRLKKWLFVRGDDAGPVFTRIRRGDQLVIRRLSAQAVYDILRRRQFPAQIERFTPHDLRRTFATSLLDNGEDIRVVQVAMGHSSIETTKRYDFSADKRTRKAIKRLKIM